MSAGFVGASVKRLEDEALLTGRGCYIDDLHMPGLLEAAFVRSPHPHARIVSIDTAAACDLPGVRARPHPRGSGRGPELQHHPVRPSHLGLSRDGAAAGAGRGRELLRRRARRHGRRRFALHRRGRGGPGGGRVRAAGVRLGLPRRPCPRRAHRASGSARQRRQGNPDRVRRLRRRIRRRAPRLRGLPQAASRGRALHRAARCRRTPRTGNGSDDGVALDAGAAPGSATSSWSCWTPTSTECASSSRTWAADSAARTSSTPTRRRRSPPRACLASRSSGSRIAASTSLPRSRNATSTGTWRSRPTTPDACSPCAGRSSTIREPTPCSRCTCRTTPRLRYRVPTCCRTTGIDVTVVATNKVGDDSGTRGRLSGGRLRHGAAARRGGAGPGTGSRRDSTAQSRAGGSDPLRAADEDPRRHADHLREWRFPGGAATRDGRGRLRRLRRAPGAGPDRRPAHRARHREHDQGHGPRSVRDRPGPHRALGPGDGLHGRDRDGTGNGDDAGADLRRASRHRPEGRHGGGGRHRRGAQRHWRIREPPDGDGGRLHPCRRAGGEGDGDQGCREPDRGGRGGPGARGRRGAGAGRSGGIGFVEGTRPGALRDEGLHAPEGHALEPRVDRRFPAARRHLRLRDARGRGRGRPRYRGRADPALRHRERQRPHRQPDAGGRAAPGRRHPRHRECVVRVDGLRRAWPAGGDHPSRTTSFPPPPRFRTSRSPTASTPRPSIPWG